VSWKQQKHQASYDYVSPRGEVLANVRMVGIKGRWRWSSPMHSRLETGWWGTKPTQEEAVACAEEYLRGKGLL
jgi:hypothetical protein